MALTRPERGALVLVEWLDIHTSAGWAGLDEKLPPAPCKSVGFVLGADEHAVTLASVLGVDPDSREAESNLRQTIPWGTVTRWRPLRPGRGH